MSFISTVNRGQEGAIIALLRQSGKLSAHDMKLTEPWANSQIFNLNTKPAAPTTAKQTVVSPTAQQVLRY